MTFRRRRRRRSRCSIFQRRKKRRNEGREERVTRDCELRLALPALFSNSPFGVWNEERRREEGSTDHRPLDIDSHRLSNPRPRPHPRKGRTQRDDVESRARVWVGSTMRFLNSNKRLPPADLPRRSPIQPPFRPFDRFYPALSLYSRFSSSITFQREKSTARRQRRRPGLRTHSLRRSYLKATQLTGHIKTQNASIKEREESTYLNF